MKNLFVISAVMLAVLSGSASAKPASTTVYRCLINGQTVYTDVPCLETKSVNLTNANAPTAADKESASQRADADQHRVAATKIAEERAVREQEAARQRDAKRARSCLKKQRQLQQLETSITKHPNSDSLKNRLLEKRDDFAAECQ